VLNIKWIDSFEPDFVTARDLTQTKF